MSSEEIEEEYQGEYASPPCFMRDVDPAYLGLPSRAERARANVMRWRKAERGRLIAERLAVQASIRSLRATQISRRLDQVIGDPTGLIVSGYWPFRGEADLRRWFETIWVRGGRVALPVVVAKGAPLVFRIWRQGDRLERSVWNILVPAGGEQVLPDIVLAPLVGYARTGYRLGYGGGFFDRTLAAMPTRRLVIGTGYKQAELFTIYPQPHDIPMDVVVTEDEIITPAW